MYAGLIEALQHYYGDVPLVMEAAEVIKELVAKVDAYYKGNANATGCVGNYGCRAAEGGGRVMAGYIDRDAAIEAIKNEWAKLPLSETTGFAILMRVLTYFPAADVQPVKTGVWTRTPYTLEADDDCLTLVYPQCSECGFIATWSSTHCPHCGAEMIGIEGITEETD